MNRNMKIGKNVLGYVAIYIMLLCNQSSVFHNIISKHIEVTILILLMLIVVLTKLYRSHLTYIGAFIGALFGICCFVQLYTSGVGLAAWKLWTAMLLGTYLGVAVNPKDTLPNFVKVVYCLSIISLIGYIGSLLFPSQLKSILYTYQNASTWRSWIGNDYTTNHHFAHGLFLYVINDNQPGRNCGIFTEPGVYQMVLNSALFILLYMKNKIVSIEEKKKFRMIIIIVITVFSTLSTTGIVMTLLLLMCYIVSRQKTENNSGNRKFRTRLVFLALMAILGVFVDLSIRGSSSILSSVVLRKVISNGAIDLSQGSGNARWGTVLLCFQSMIKHPLGIGYTNVQSMLNVSVTGYLAAQIMQTGAALGIIPFCFIIGWIMLPILKSRQTRFVKLLFVIMYFNTALAQSREFYPAFVMFTIWFALYGDKKTINRRQYQYMERGL